MASPFQKPVGALRSRLLAELSTVEQSRQAVDDLIFSAEAHLASLIEERYIISREIEGRKANLSPINYVPFEVLGNIFIQVIRLRRTSRSRYTTRGRLISLAARLSPMEGHCKLIPQPVGRAASCI
ncbi:hypothetical protein FRC16_007877 [Serendipita sp. 398]|nr:hypothetical protein FRC16_007877 [Serendipita sp. 398]